MGHGMAAFDNVNRDFTFYFTGLQFQHCKKPLGWQEGVDASLASPEVDNQLIQNVLEIMYNDMMVIPYIEQKAFGFRLPGVNDPDWEKYPEMSVRYMDIFLDKSLR